jgi:tRNA-(ms[2]io[6]A)-hydroxylase
MVSEAGHHKLFLELAIGIRGKEFIDKRWMEWLEFEASVLQKIELRGDRMH